MSLFRRAVWVLVCGGLLGLVGVVPEVGSAVAASKKAACSPTAFVANFVSGTVSTIDVKTRTKNPTDITVGAVPDLGGGHAGRQDRLRRQEWQRHGVDD